MLVPEDLNPSPRGCRSNSWQPLHESECMPTKTEFRISRWDLGLSQSRRVRPRAKQSQGTPNGDAVPPPGRSPRDRSDRRSACSWRAKARLARFVGVRRDNPACCRDERALQERRKRLQATRLILSFSFGLIAPLSAERRMPRIAPRNQARRFVRPPHQHTPCQRLIRPTRFRSSRFSRAIWRR
jgi:hypothetical protein